MENDTEKETLAVVNETEKEPLELENDPEIEPLDKENDPLDSQNDAQNDLLDAETDSEIEPEPEIVQLMANFTIPEDFAVILEPIIIPLSLDEYWNAFYTDDAPFDIEELQNINDERDEIIYTTNWFTPNETEFMTSFNQTVL